MAEEPRLTGQTQLEALDREREKEFLRAHLLPWLPAFCEAGRRATSDRLCLATFALLESLVAAETARLDGEHPAIAPAQRPVAASSSS